MAGGGERRAGGGERFGSAQRPGVLTAEDIEELTGHVSWGVRGEKQS